MHDRKHFALAAALAFVVTIASPFWLVAQGPVAASSSGVDQNADERWSFDDIKDVFEAIHFFAITLGIGVGVWWFATRYLSRAPNLVVDLGVGTLSSISERRVVELVATVRNDGANTARIMRCLFSIAVVEPAAAGQNAEVLREGTGLSRLIEGEFMSSATAIAAGASLGLTTVVALPGDHKHCLLTARIELQGGSRALVCSRLFSLAVTPA